MLALHGWMADMLQPDMHGHTDLQVYARCTCVSPNVISPWKMHAMAWSAENSNVSDDM